MKSLKTKGKLFYKKLKNIRGDSVFLLMKHKLEDEDFITSI